MANLLINNWGGGIGDDPFLSRTGECLDMENIDIRTTSRKITCSDSLLGIYATASAPYNDTLNHASDSIEGVIQSYGSHCYVGFGNIDALVAGADRHITVGSNTADYNITTNPEGLRHIFFTYDNSTNPIKVVGYTAGVRAIITPTANTSGGAAPATIPASLRTTAVCYLWEGAVIFARGSKIYEYNPSTQVLATGAKISLPIGAIVKNIYYYGGLIQIVYTINNDTFIHGCSYSSTTYTLNTYADKTPGEKCLSSTMSNNTIYWLSTGGIFEYSGTSQLVKKYTFSSSAICSYNKGILRIGDGNTLLEFGIQKSGYGKPLTKTASTLTIAGVTESSIVLFQSGANTFRIDSFASGYKNAYYTLHPYTAGQFGWTKKGLGFLIGYTLPRGTYTSPSVQCTITVAIQTDDTFATNTATFHTIATISDNTKRYIEIMPNDINKALETAGFSSDFGWIKLKLTLNAGDAYASYGNTIFRKTPEVFDVYLKHEEILNSFK